MTPKQIERFADVLQAIGMGALGAGAGDALFGARRILLDAVCVAAGVIAISVSIWLTGKLDGGKV